MSRVVILHTSDLHGHLTPAAARQLGGIKTESAGARLFDCGDAVSAGNLAFHVRGERVLRLMAEAGYDAMAMGNRESHPSRYAQEQKLKDATFPVLSANMVAKSGGALPERIRPWTMCESAGLRLAVFGLTPQMTKPDSMWAKVTDFVWEEPVATARKLAAELKQQADLVVCLSHCGFRTDRVLVEIAELDLVLGGHSHQNFVEHTPGRALLVHPGKFGSHVSHTTLASRDDAQSELIELEKGP
jgi:5'-nucleotidase